MPILSRHEGISFSSIIPSAKDLNCNLIEKFLWNRGFLISYREYDFLYNFNCKKIDNIYILQKYYV